MESLKSVFDHINAILKRLDAVEQQLQDRTDKVEEKETEIENEFRDKDETQDSDIDQLMQEKEVI